jgi:hypothetical protein
MHTARRLITAGVVFLVFLGVGAVVAWAANHGSLQGRPVCGPPGSTTSFTRGTMRIYSARGQANHSAAIVCDQSLGSARVRLGDGPIKAPFAIARPWAAGVEGKLEGVDTASINVVSANIQTRKNLACQIGVANRPGQLPSVKRLWAASDGRIAVTAVVPLQSGPELAVCSRGRLRVLASGSEIVLRSVELRGRFLSWSDGARRQSIEL